jgi:hypothetical protein
MLGASRRSDSIKAVPHGVIAKRSKGLGGAECADYDGGIALVSVDFGIEVAHFFGRDFVGEIGEGPAELREFGQGVASDDRDGVVRREVVLVVYERYEVERLN